jgi:hypothetical protein
MVKVEEQVAALRELPARIVELTSQISQFRTEMGAGFSAVRTEMDDRFSAVRTEMGAGFSALRTEMDDRLSAVRTEMGAGFSALRTEMRAGDEETRSQMRMLHEDLVRRIALLREGSSGTPEK